MKKIVSLFAFALLTFLTGIYVSASSPTLTVSGGASEAGGTVQVTISASDNPGVAFVRLFVDYDRLNMTLVSVEDGGLLGTPVHSPDMTPYPYVLFWNNGTATNDYAGNGVIATLTFRLSDSASGTLPVTVSYDNANDDIMNVDFDRIEFDVVNGSVTVSGTAPTVEHGGVTYEISENTLSVRSAANASGTVRIPKTVTYDGKEYAVTAISDGAFGGSPATAVRLGGNITGVSANAFDGFSGMIFVRQGTAAARALLGQSNVYAKGDAALDDNSLGMNDALELLNYLADPKIKLTALERQIADVYDDGYDVLNIADAIRMKQFLASPNTVELD